MCVCVCVGGGGGQNLLAVVGFEQIHSGFKFSGFNFTRQATAGNCREKERPRKKSDVQMCRCS